jgi:hypothetical protein
MRIILEPMSSSGFQEIDIWDTASSLKKLLGRNIKLIVTNESGIVLIAEERSKGVYNQGYAISLLDRIALAVSKADSFYYRVRGKKKRISKDDAKTIANILNEQSKKLESMSATYRIMATALLNSADNFIEISKSDKHIRNLIENPFD